MERPALKALLDDIRAGKIQTVVVYKIDRLTRSLMDFAKLVDVFDEYGVTFVSVTQSFNTTTSMGRLTLNVLLSFAQFEREVTGERIRDKIAASKKKGMWMGGMPPLGYQRIDKKLVPHSEEAGTVRFIFTEYLRLGTVRRLAEYMQHKKMKTPVRVSAKDRVHGGAAYSRGKLYKMLSNPVYTGKICHKDKVYEGQHEGIIDQKLYDKVQAQLKTQGPDAKNGTLPSGSLLKGLIYDCDGVIYSPTYTMKKDVRYTYYLSQNLIQYRHHPKGIMARIPAHEIEEAVTAAIKGWMTDFENVQKVFPDSQESYLYWLTENTELIQRQSARSILKKVTVRQDTLDISMGAEALRKDIAKRLDVVLSEPEMDTITINTPFKPSRANNGTIILNAESRKDKDPLDLPADQLKRIVRGIIWRDEHFAGTTLKDIAAAGGHGENYVNRCIQESFVFLSQ